MAPGSENLDDIPLGNLLAFNHLGVNTAIGVAESAHQSLRDAEIPHRGYGIDVGGGGIEARRAVLDGAAPIALYRLAGRERGAGQTLRTQALDRVPVDRLDFAHGCLRRNRQDRTPPDQ
jgi:hypothetical protein